MEEARRFSQGIDPSRAQAFLRDLDTTVEKKNRYKASILAYENKERQFVTQMEHNMEQVGKLLTREYFVVFVYGGGCLSGGLCLAPMYPSRAAMFGSSV